MADTQLLPCPFCGGDAQTDFIEGESYLIECYACRAETGIKDSEEDAIAAWNRRATEPSPSTAPVEDHVVREVVNRLRDTALEFHAHGSLRERLARQLDPLLVASRPAEVDEAWVLLFEALPHVSPQAVNWAMARVGAIEEAYIGTRIRKYLERVAAPSRTTNMDGA